MKLLRSIVVLALFLSVILNVIQWQRNEKRRAQLIVNGRTLTKRDYHDWLEQHDGPLVQAQMVQYYLVTEEAKRQGVAPTPQAVDELVEEWKDAHPADVQALKTQPWKQTDLERGFELQLALAGLTTKDVKATPDEVRDFYNASPSKWDTPDKFTLWVVGCTDAQTASEVKESLGRLVARAGKNLDSLAPDVSLMPSNYPGKVGLSGDSGSVTLRLPFGSAPGDAVTREIVAMRPGEIREVPQAQGKVAVIVMRQHTPGKHASLDDPEVHKKVELAFKLTRAVPQREELQKLWDAAEIDVDPPSLKDVIRGVILPQQVSPRAQASTQPQ